MSGSQVLGKKKELDKPQISGSPVLEKKKELDQPQISGSQVLEKTCGSSCADYFEPLS